MNIQEAIAHARQVAEGCGTDRDCAYQHDKLADWLEELIQLRQEVIKLTKERDIAVNCIYGVRTALENGDRNAAMEEVITYEFGLTSKEDANE